MMFSRVGVGGCQKNVVVNLTCPPSRYYFSVSISTLATCLIRYSTSHIIMPFRRFVEIGRVAYIAFGDDKGKLAVILDVLDQNRALVDGPCSGVCRKSINFKALQLTPLTLNIPRSVRTGTLMKAWKKGDVEKQWEATKWAQKLANQQKKAQMNDFDRFKLMKAKQARNRIINVEFGKLRKAAKGKASKKVVKK